MSGSVFSGNNLTLQEWHAAVLGATVGAFSASLHALSDTTLGVALSVTTLGVALSVTTLGVALSDTTLGVALSVTTLGVALSDTTLGVALSVTFVAAALGIARYGSVAGRTVKSEPWYALAAFVCFGAVVLGVA
jgi:hypothetical protein